MLAAIIDVFSIINRRRDAVERCVVAVESAGSYERRVEFYAAEIARHRVDRLAEADGDADFLPFLNT